MRLILLAGYKPCTPNEAPWLEIINNKPCLEQRLIESKYQFREKIVVLGGDSADETLLRCPSIENAELVFDTNDKSLSLISNLRSALKLGVDPALILPANLPLGEVDNYKALIAHTVKHGIRADFHIVQSVTQSGELSNFGFPLVLTLRGCQLIAKDKDINSLADPKLLRELVPTQLASLAVHP